MIRLLLDAGISLGRIRRVLDGGASELDALEAAVGRAREIVGLLSA